MMALIARPKAGKSTLLVKLIDSVVKNGRRVLVVDPDGGEMIWYDKRFKRYDDITKVPANFKGVAVVLHSDKPEMGTATFPYIQSKLDTRQNGGVRGPWAGVTMVLDDANRYAKGAVEPALEFLLQRKRQYGVDLLVTAHSWHQAPPIFFQFIDIYIIGPTHSGPETRSDIIKGEAMVKMRAVREKVNALKAADADSYPWSIITADGRPFNGIL